MTTKEDLESFEALDPSIFNTSGFRFSKGDGGSREPFALTDLIWLPAHSSIYYTGESRRWGRASSTALLRSVHELSDSLDDALSRDIDTERGCRQFLALYAKIVKSGDNVAPWPGYTPQVWVDAALEKLRPLKDEASSLLRTTFYKDFSLRMVKPLCNTLLPDATSFPEAHRAASDFQKAQSDRLLEGENLFLADVEESVSGREEAEIIQLVYSTRSDMDNLVVVPSAVAAYLSSAFHVDLGRFPSGEGSEKLAAIVETVNALYEPSDRNSPYSNLQDTLDAAVELC